jgi:hypothetical protein
VLRTTEIDPAARRNQWQNVPDEYNNSRVFRGRCNSEPAVIVREPAASSGWPMWWNSTTDGESPDGRFTRVRHRRVPDGRASASLHPGIRATGRVEDQWICKNYSCGC